MKRHAGLLAVLPPAIVSVCAVFLIITQALGAPSPLAERLLWLSIEAVIAAAWAYQITAARAWRRLYRNLDELYDKCEASRDYWMEAAQWNGWQAIGQEPDP